MKRKPSARPRPADESHRRASQRITPGLLEPRELDLPAEIALPQVRLRSTTWRPLIYQRMIDSADPAAAPGDLVALLDPQGFPCGYGLYNPRSEIAVRVLSREAVPPNRAFWTEKLDQAVALRQELLRLDQATDAYRLIHAEADGLSGLVVDRLGDTLSAELFSLGMYQRVRPVMDYLAQKLGARHTRVAVDQSMHGQEGFLAEPIASPDLPGETVIREFGTRFKVRFADGHKTGFFCDQRENRRQLAAFCQGRTVLDLCCYTGGFAVQAMKLGQAASCIAVDLDEKALAVAKANADLNQVRLQLVHADAFGYQRDLIRAGRQFDVVVLDPPKLIRNRREIEEGSRKTFDLNRLALQLVRPGGLLLSCSCSGLLGGEEFLRLIYAAARSSPAGSTSNTAAVPGETNLPATATSGSDRLPLKPRMLQLLARTGAAADHPISPQCPETEYLHAMWLRVV